MILSEVFAAARSSRIEWDGPLYGLYPLPAESSALRLSFLSQSSRLRQGIRLKISGGTLVVNGHTARDLVLWEDTPPSEVEVFVRWHGSSDRSLRVWNCWERNGLIDAWTGNSGFRVEEAGDGVVVLRCSDGDGDPDFQNLVVSIQIELEVESTQRATESIG